MISEIAERYAQGMYELAVERGNVRGLKEQAEELQTVLKENPDFLLFLQAVKVTKEEKKETIDKIFASFDHDIVSFLKLLTDRGRTYYLNEILQACIDKADENLGIQRAAVTSARPLSDTDLNQIRKVLEQKTGKQIVLENKIDPAVIAGIKVTVGSQVTDITMKTRMEQMKDALLKGGQA